MMLPITGTIRDAVKLAELDNKWKQKRDLAEKKKKELTPEEKQIERYKEDAEKMRENRQIASLDAKLEAGAGLTPEEIAYLRKNHPQKYKDYLETKKEQEHYKEELESCETKEDVEELKMTKLGEFAAECKSVANNPNIPEGKKVELLGKILKKIAGVQKVHEEFVKSLRYQSLPTQEEVAEKAGTETDPNAEQSKEAGTEAKKDIFVPLPDAQEVPREAEETGTEKDISVPLPDAQEVSEVTKETEKEENTKPVFSETDKNIENNFENMEIDFEKIETELKEYLKPYRA